jgi:ATP-dependent DNA helicase DinG
VRAADLLGQDGPLARALPGYERREAQLTMARMVEDVLAHEGVALIEAGTGTGKTLAYLVPALLSGKKVVISTGTRTLQDQIMEHDLPVLERHLGVPVRAACMKGLGNYLCRRRYRELLTSAETAEPSLARRLPMLMDWVARTEQGDRAELEGLPEDDPVWAAVMSGSETRIGARCSHYEECFVTAMRRRAEEARLVIVNHHLFFADLATRGPHGGGVLPDYDAVIFDEAHQIEDVATTFFGAQVSEQRLEKLARDFERAFASAGVASVESSRLVSSLMRASDAFFDALPTPRVEGSRMELPTDFLAGPSAQAFHGLDAAIEAMHFACMREAGASEAIAQLARRSGQVQDELGRIVDGARTDVVYCERRGQRRLVGASPVDVSTTFRRGVLQRVPSVVLTSATLTAGGSFDFVKRRLGIDFEVDEAVLPSPFDYATQAALYLPALPDPRAAEYADRAVEEVLRLVKLTGGGAFVLCTSMRMVSLLASRCRPALTSHVLVQGEGPKGALLDRFRRDGHAVLFATLSFWEGVDVPGDALRLVVMDKLPFDVPSDPLVEARCRRLEEEGEAPFIRYLVPSAALTLKQGFGRLIRTARDRGIVAILDARIRTKGYGHVFLRSLPDARRCHTFAEVEAFWAAITAA